MLLRIVPILLSLCALLLSAQGASLSAADFGAIPNDDKDDAAAINQGVAQAQPGDTVTIPEGTFILSGQLVLKSSITLTGAGQAQTRLVHSGDKPHCFIRMKAASDVEVRDMTLDGANSPNAQQGIVGTTCSNLFLHHLTIQNFVDTGTFGPHAILCSGTSDSMYSDNTILNMAPEDPWGAGIRVSEPCTGNRILRNIIHNTGRGGIFTNNGATDVVISENIITGSHGIAFAIEVHSRSVRTVVEDNIVDHGLSIVSANCATRRNTVIDPSGTWGSYGIEGGGGPHGIVTDNVIDYGQKQGISLSGPQRYMLWARNRFVNCSQWGIQLQGPREDKIRCLYFYDNTFSKAKTGHPSARYPGHDGHAIRFNGNTEYVVFDSNRITDNAGLGIQLTSGKGVSHLTFINNIITNNAQGSINHYPDSAPIIWESNLVSGNGTDTQLETRGFTGEPPIASFSCPDTARVGEPVQFQNTSTAPNSEIDQVLWDFDAGIPCTDSNPAYTYKRPGAYRVSLIVWNKAGRANRAAERTIRVTAGR